ncbi:PIR Superfamily Protein [Plasmodium ovale wallikeri]|uniref:PIR Superfamily Protein n=1 Tax=Plasmodium ovale wallikeri TaxID=864142 RepID=A0A1A9ANS5_PLAOA|nr:PIR Superfamily Protein [Plasmodium ovale wallikeri]
MGVDVTFSSQSRGKTCTDEYSEIDPDDDKKLEVVNETDETDSTFLQKCSVLKQYLVSYNEKYKHCFNSEAAVYFLANREMINTALTRCTRYEKLQETLEREKGKKVVTEKELGEKHTQEEDLAVRTVSSGKEGEPTAECKEEICKTPHSREQTKEETNVIGGEEPDSRGDKVVAGFPQEPVLVYNSLSTNPDQSGHENHLSEADSEEITTSTCYTGITDTDVPGHTTYHSIDSPDDEVTGTLFTYNLKKILFHTFLYRKHPVQIIFTDVADATLEREPSREMEQTFENVPSTGESSLLPEVASQKEPKNKEGKQLSPEFSQESTSEQISLHTGLAHNGILLIPQEGPGTNPIKMYIIIILVILAIVLLSILIFKVK